MQMTVTQRRQRARWIRGMVRGGSSMIEACEAHKVSRARGYQILEELEVWEKSVTLQEELNEIHRNMRANGLDVRDEEQWTLASGKLVWAHMQGEDAKLSVVADEPIRDPLCD